MAVGHRIQPPYLTLQFISGVFFSTHHPRLVGSWPRSSAEVDGAGVHLRLLPDWVAVDDYGGGGT
jgi:hypothetical protein